MKPDFGRNLIPRDDALHLIGALNALKDRTYDAAQQWELLHEDGNVPVAPSFAALLQHAVDAQELSRDVLRLTAEFVRSPHHTTPVGSDVLKDLALAATASSYAVPRFAETAENALARLRMTNPSDLQYLTSNMVFDHATGRSHLRRTSEALRNAAKELDDHLGFQRFRAQLTPAEGPPAPPPPRSSSRNR